MLRDLMDVENVSFTGTRHGMSDKQKKNFRDLIARLQPKTFSHGCCIGSDIEAHKIVAEVTKGKCKIYVFPSNHPVTKAAIPPDSFYVAPEKPPLARNLDIVNHGNDLLIATPQTLYEIRRSGTWAAIRYARKKNIPQEILER